MDTTGLGLTNFQLQHFFKKLSLKNDVYYLGKIKEDPLLN